MTRKVFCIFSIHPKLFCANWLAARPWALIFDQLSASLVLAYWLKVVALMSTFVPVIAPSTSAVAERNTTSPRGFEPSGIHEFSSRRLRSRMSEKDLSLFTAVADSVTPPREEMLVPCSTEIFASRSL